MSFPGIRIFSDKEQIAFFTSSELVRTVHTLADTRPLVHACRGLPRRRGRAPLCINLVRPVSPLISRMLATILYLALLFTRSHRSLPQQKFLHKTFSFPLLFSLHAAPIKLSLLPSKSCAETKAWFFLHCKKEVRLHESSF